MGTKVWRYSEFSRGALAVCCLMVLLSFSDAQQFQNPPLIATSPDPVGLVTADFNSDGNPDLAYVTVGQATVLHMLLGNGKGGFDPDMSVTLPAGTCVFEQGLCSLTVGDFTGSGHPGILLAGKFPTSWGFVVLPGNGDGTFGTAVVSNIPAFQDALGTYVGFTRGVAAFRSDGNLDIAEPDYIDGQIRIYFGDGKGTFTAGPVLSDYLQPIAIYTADVNHDGSVDLVAIDESGLAEVWLGSGTGSFTNSQRYPASSVPAFFAADVTDINGDGNVDVLGSDRLGDVEVMIGTSDGTFNPPQTIARGFESGFANAIFPVDLTGNGIPDLLVNSAEGFDTEVAAGPLAYLPVQKRTSGPFLSQLATADFNHDGAPDMAVGVSGGIEFFFGNSSGTFPDSTITPVTVPATFLFAGDFTGDGIADVVAAGTDEMFRTYAGSSSGAFQAPVTSPNPVSTAFGYMGNVVGDFDGDGHKDILLSGNALFGNGDGSFTDLSMPVESNGQAADLTNNGIDDLLSISSSPQSGPGSYTFYYSLIALLGSSQRTFIQVSTSLTTPPNSLGIVNPVLFGAHDMNGDGIPDAVVYNPNFPEIELWLGNGDGSFHEGTILPAGSPWTPVSVGIVPGTASAVADLDGDGSPDLVFLATEMAPDSTLVPVTVAVIEYGDGKGDFPATTVIPLSHAFTGLTLVKPQSGALPEIAVCNASQIALLRNLGNRQFSGEEPYLAGSIAGTLGADFTGSGRDDLLILRANGKVSPNSGANGFTVLMSQKEASGNGSGIANGSLLLSPPTVNYNQSFTVTAVLAASSSGAPVPTGSISFSANGLSLGSAILSGGTATASVPGSVTQSLPPGLMSISATYSGDSYYASQYMQTTLQILNPIYSTQTALALSEDDSPVASIQAGSFITLAATVTAPATVPRGYIAFKDGTTVLGNAEIQNQQATFSTNLLALGMHSLTAQYLGYTPPTGQVGTSVFLPSTSSPVPLTVTGIATTATLTPSASGVTAGTVLTITAKVASASGTPIGGVTFFDGSTAMGTIALDSNGTADFSTASLSTGTHTITAQYGANGIYAASTTAPVTVAVSAPSTALAPTFADIDSVLPGRAGSTAITVHVTGAHGGSVSLIVDGHLAGNHGVSTEGSAMIPIMLSGPGMHFLSASYSGGSATAAPSASPQLNTTAYTTSDFTLSAGGVHVDSLGALTVPLSIGAVGSWGGMVSFQCVSGLPAGYVCKFSPAAQAGRGTTVLMIARTAPLPLTAMFMLPLPLLWVFRRRRSARKRIGLVLGLSILFLSGCSVGHSNGVSSTHVISVQASDGTHVHSIQIVAELIHAK